MTQLIHVVMGMTGEYSDRTEWPVRAYADVTRAQEHVRKAADRARELEQWRDGDDDAWRYADVLTRPSNEYDPMMQMQYTGTTYFLYETELET